VPEWAGELRCLIEKIFLMTDNNIDNHIDVAKPERIYLYQAYEVKYWTRKFGVSEDELKRAVKAVGHRAPDIELYFKRDKT
jgi:Protein of unknown function (DUF3606)